MSKISVGFRKCLFIIIAVSMSLFLVACSSPTTPSPTPTPAPTTETPQADLTINLSAENLAFDRSTIRVPRGPGVLAVVFTNKDNVPHNLAIYETSEAINAIFVGEIITGPKTITYLIDVPSDPGVYFFRCDVHPTTMTGDFVVTGSTS